MSRVDPLLVMSIVSYKDRSHECTKNAPNAKGITMVTCVATGCSNSTSRKKARPGITFHRFPKDVSKRNAWVSAVRRKDWTPSSTSSLCSTHFEEKHIDRTRPSLVTLREGAIPSIFPGSKPQSQVAQVQQKEGCVPEQDTIVATEVPEKEKSSAIGNDTEYIIVCCEGVTDVKLSGSNETIPVPPHNDVLVMEERGNGPISHCQLANKDTTNTFNSPGIVLVEIENEHNSPRRKQTDEQQGCTKVMDSSKLKRTNGFVTDEETPRMKKLCRKQLVSTERLEQSRKKVKVLQQSQRRLKNRVTSLRNVVRSLKRNAFVEKKSTDMLNAISGSTLGSIVNRQLQKATNATLQKDYDQDLRSFAISLHRISQKAYAYVRQTFDCLPHPKTVSRWHREPLIPPNSLTNPLIECLTDPLIEDLTDP